jgi:transcriptional regulator with AAA-type ATPase domain
MRTPSYEELSKEQDAVCVLAPLDKATMVFGPPGTGKTVVAF